MYKNMGIGPLKLQNSDNYTGHPCQNTNHCNYTFYRPCSDEGKKTGDIMCADWTEADYRQDREDAYIVGLLWSINAGINFNIQIPQPFSHPFNSVDMVMLLFHSIYCIFITEYHCK